MADSLKTFFDGAVVERLGEALQRVEPSFPREAFRREASTGLERHELLGRARHIATALHHALPSDYPRAVDVLVRSLGPELERTEDNGFSVFFYLPHVLYVAEYGLGHLEESLLAQYELTKRFTAEFSIRAYLERHPGPTLARLRKWAGDSNVHVRRLVSEGTRPRLPWAPRLRAFQKDPTPVLELLELLKDDPALYVRRSVANNLNDIGKDHPARLVEVAREWMRDAPPEREWLIRHALRSAVKRGEREALEVLGFGPPSGVEARAVAIPRRVRLGSTVELRFEVLNRSRRSQALEVDLAVHFMKARGETRPKVFKVRSVTLAPGEAVVLDKRISFEQLTTRRHYPGRHPLEVLVNGQALPLGELDVSS